MPACEQNKTKKIWACAGFAFVFASLIAGCSSITGDTSGYKPPPDQSKADIEKQIADIKSNPKIPDNIKQMAISNEQRKLAEAK